MAPPLSTSPAAGAAFKMLPVLAHTPTNHYNSSPNVVLVDLHTTIVIPDFDLYYNGRPIQSFQPSYHALGDGSLVATPFIVDVRSANILLALFGALAMFFVMNTVSAAYFVRIGKVKRMGLFYVLFSSQLLGTIAMLTPIITYFDQFVSCTVVSFILVLCSGASLSLLMTGILGYKAYRCLDSSRIVLAILVVLRVTMIVLMGVSLSRLKVSRRLSGSCMPPRGTHIMPYLVILQTTESAFICGCFLYAVRKTSRSTTYQGRLSIGTLPDARKGPRIGASEDLSHNDEGQGRRGWWDYVPEASQSEFNLRSDTPKISAEQRPRSIKLPKFSYPSSGMTSQGTYRKSSIREEHPIPQPHLREPSVTFSYVQPTRDSNSGEASHIRHRRISSASSVMSRISKYMPRMQLFRKVLKNELCYTAFLTVVYLIMAILMLICSRQRILMSSLGWLLCDWLVVSVFSMHSFRRVVRRHERETILQHPAAWDPLYRAQLEAARAFNNGSRSRRDYSPISFTSSRPTQRRPTSDPFEDFVLDTSSARFEPIPQGNDFSERSLSPHSERSRQSSHDSDSVVSAALSYGNPSGEVDLTALPFYSGGDWESTAPLPSPRSV